jgi:hypothetical protein
VKKVIVRLEKSRSKNGVIDFSLEALIKPMGGVARYFHRMQGMSDGDDLAVLHEKLNGTDLGLLDRIFIRQEKLLISRQEQAIGKEVL